MTSSAKMKPKMLGEKDIWTVEMDDENVVWKRWEEVVSCSNYPWNCLHEMQFERPHGPVPIEPFKKMDHVNKVNSSLGPNQIAINIWAFIWPLKLNNTLSKYNL